MVERSASIRLAAAHWTRKEGTTWKEVEKPRKDVDVGEGTGPRAERGKRNVEDKGGKKTAKKGSRKVLETMVDVQQPVRLGGDPGSAPSTPNRRRTLNQVSFVSMRSDALREESVPVD